MTKFERIGVELQQEAVNVRHAKRNFRYSCDVCCNRGLRIDCDKCAIAATHSMVVASFEILKETTPCVQFIKEQNK